jgi:hypothetical protein
MADEETPTPAVAVAVAEPAEPAAPETPMAEAAAAHAARADAAASSAAEAAIVTAGLAEAAAAERIASFEERLDQCQANVGGLADRLEGLALQTDNSSNEMRTQLSQILTRLETPPEPALTSPPISPDDVTPQTPESPAEDHQAQSQPEPEEPRRKAHRWI